MGRLLVRGLGSLVLGTSAFLSLAGNAQEKKIESGTAPIHKNDLKTSEEFAKLLQTKGVTGLVHGNIPGAKMYVFVYDDPIAGGERYSLIPKNDDVKKKIESLSRHQVVTIFGKLSPKGTPQQHIVVDDLKAEKPWEPKVTFKYKDQPYRSVEDLKTKLEGKSEINCEVHANLQDGKVLIVNYDGDVLPVHVTDPKCTNGLRSSDKIALRYTVRQHAEGPIHLALKNEGDKPPIKVLESILPFSESTDKFTKKGNLVWFPPSPLINREEGVWGLEEKDSNGLKRTYSLFNLRNTDDVENINKLLKAEWDKKTDGFIRSTSRFIHPEIHIEVFGDIMHFTINQRNPLIDLDSKDIKILK